MGMVAILVMWPGPFEQFSIPPTYWSNWPNNFRGEVVWNKFMSRKHYFCHSRASNSEVKYQIWSKFDLVWDFMPVLDTCKFKEVAIKTQGSMGRTTFFTIITQWEFFCLSRASNSAENNPTWPNSNWFEILCLSWIPASLKKLQSKLKVLWPWQHFPIISLWENFLSLRGK